MSVRAAVVGIGSNSVRALMAETDGGAFRRVYRDREGTRLFAGLDAEGRLRAESMLKTAGAVARMTAEARERGAEWVGIFATSAARDAANGEEFLSTVERDCGIRPEILSGEEEARMSFLGASRVAGENMRCGVIDIGGGSTEIVTGLGWETDTAFSCQMGAVRLFRQIPLERKEDMAAAEEAAAEILAEKEAEIREMERPACWIGTGGTFTTLAAMTLGIPWTDRSCMHGTKISREQIRGIGEKLAEMPVEERKKLPGLQPGRADIVVHGICILLAVMERFDMEGITVSEWGNLDGYLWEKMMKEEGAEKNA